MASSPLQPFFLHISAGEGNCTIHHLYCCMRGMSQVCGHPTLSHCYSLKVGHLHLLCREFVRTANAAGGKAELTVLPDIGIRGNSHMLMQDKNSLTIAHWLVDWINRHVGSRPSVR